MKHIFWTAYTGKKGSIAIFDLQSIISKYGSIVNLKKISDISLSVVIKIEENKITTLYAELLHYTMLDTFLPLESNSKKERVIFLKITFASGSRD